MKKQIVYISATLLLASSNLFGQPNPQFVKANQEFAAGNFKAAIEDYESLVRAHQDTANLFYNLGNAYFRTRDFARSILNYQRALALDPHHPEAAANLQIVRDEAHALELVPGKWERLFDFGNENEFVTTAAVAFWVFAFLLAAFLFNHRRLVFVLSILSLVIAAIAGFASYELEHGKNGSGLAVVVGDNVEARLATADSSTRVLTLPAGSEIKVVSERGDWVYAELPNDLRGWVQASDAERVRM